MIEDLTSTEFVDRLPIRISNGEDEQLLGVPKLSDGSAESQANAIMTCLDDWGVTNRISALCFDTTATNTGQKAGTSLKLESKMGKNLLHFACRHHIMELIIGGAFNAALGATSTGEHILLKFHPICSCNMRIMLLFIFCPMTTLCRGGGGRLPSYWCQRVLI